MTVPLATRGYIASVNTGNIIIQRIVSPINIIIKNAHNFSVRIRNLNMASDGIIKLKIRGY